jgi:hypothetical protein
LAQADTPRGLTVISVRVRTFQLAALVGIVTAHGRSRRRRAWHLPPHLCCLANAALARRS